LTKIKKSRGRLEDFDAAYISAAVAKAGAKVRESVQVAKEVSQQVAHKTEITAEELSETVVKSLRKVNNAAADQFVKYRDERRKAKT
jgi:transcriptional regulator NrdR family protein